MALRYVEVEVLGFSVQGLGWDLGSRVQGFMRTLGTFQRA